MEADDAAQLMSSSKETIMNYIVCGAGLPPAVRAGLGHLHGRDHAELLPGQPADRGHRGEVTQQ